MLVYQRVIINKNGLNQAFRLTHPLVGNVRNFQVAKEAKVEIWVSLEMRVYQWPFQDPIDWRYLPYIRPKFQGISPENMARNMVLTYLHFGILEFPLNNSILGT